MGKIALLFCTLIRSALKTYAVEKSMKEFFSPGFKDETFLAM